MIRSRSTRSTAKIMNTSCYLRCAKRALIPPGKISLNIRAIAITSLLFLAFGTSYSRVKPNSPKLYPAVWFAPINDPNKPSWEILPQEAKPGEVILSKRNELGILSNFAATPFEMDGKRYASVEGFWQMMLYPEGPDDERAKDKRVNWKFTREQVAQMTAFEAKSAGMLAEENMKTVGIDWCTYNGKRFPYRSPTPGEHYRLIVAAMRAKLEQN